MVKIFLLFACLDASASRPSSRPAVASSAPSTRPASRPSDESVRFAKAIRERRVLVGMTVGQARVALCGDREESRRPDALSEVPERPSRGDSLETPAEGSDDDQDPGRQSKILGDRPYVDGEIYTWTLFERRKKVKRPMWPAVGPASGVPVGTFSGHAASRLGPGPRYRSRQATPLPRPVYERVLVRVVQARIVDGIVVEVIDDRASGPEFVRPAR